MLSALIAAVTLNPLAATPAKTIYDFKVNDIDGKAVSLEKYKGKVLLVVNVASKCGNTPQYKGLQTMYSKYREKGFVILGFPANDFRGQEPGSDAEIKEFCTAEYGVTFPMFSKIPVTGQTRHPLYTWLVENADRHEEVEWNFAKFLVSREGKVIGRFTPKTQPDSEILVQAVEKAL